MSYFPQATTGGGVCATPGPMDVCKVPAPPAPPIPTPFPNISQVRNATDTVDKVKAKNKPVVVEKSNNSSSNGDEPGALKGLLKSPKLANECYYLKASGKVFATGKKCVYHLVPTAHNGKNLPAGGVHCAPSQTSVLTHV